MNSYPMRFRPVMLMLPSPSPLKQAKVEDCAAPLSRRFDCKTGGNGVRNALTEIKQMVNIYESLTPELRTNCEVVLAEVLNNIAEHSYQGRPDCAFSVEITLSDQCIVVETSDNGEPMPGLKLPEKRLPSQEVPRDVLPEGGFGWYLIHVLAPDPVYLRRDGTNVLRFVLNNPCGPCALPSAN